MIKSFRCKRTEGLFRGTLVPREFQAFVKVAVRRLDMLDAAETLNDLRVPPGNHLEALKRDRRGQHSIKINDQWRICFVWRDGAESVEIIDYH
jgi:proteic killer suppression protein